jgi:hypothetical protein
MVDATNNFIMPSYEKGFPELYTCSNTNYVKVELRKKSLFDCFHVQPQDKAVALARALY